MTTAKQTRGAPLKDPEYGGTFFARRDPKGYVRHIGSCGPWAEPPA